MKDFSLKILAKNVGVLYTWQNMVILFNHMDLGNVPALPFDGFDGSL